MHVMAHAAACGSSYWCASCACVHMDARAALLLCSVEQKLTVLSPLRALHDAAVLAMSASCCAR